MTDDRVEKAELALALGEIDPDMPSPARIYDFWLGGSHNFPADREVGRRTAEVMPGLPLAAVANRVFLGRAVHHLVNELGVTQFLDLGSGVPTAGNVHEVAKAANPDARVVYVDIDPVAIAHARSILADVPGCGAILADLREPAAVLGHPLLRETFDFTQPIAVLMFAVLHFIDDEGEPATIVREFMKPTAPGSYLAISHGAPDPKDPAAQLDAARSYAARTGVPFVPRTFEQLMPFLDGLELIPPGLVPITEWMPDALGAQVPVAPSYGGVARKS